MVWILNFKCMKELKNYKFIILCGDHYNPLGVVRSLGEYGLFPIVILVSYHPILVNKSKYIAQLHVVSSFEDGLKLLIKEYGNETGKKPFLYVCDDGAESLLDRNYKHLKDRFYFFSGRESGIVTHFMNKDSINMLAKECGFNIPKTEVLRHGMLPTSLQYPVITKSIMSIVGGWKDDVFICKDENELIDAYTKIKSDTVLVEEYIEKKNELCLDGFAINNGKDIYIPYQTQYIRFTPKSYGNYMVLTPFQDTQILNGVKKILESIGFNGIFSVEFLIDKKDSLYFLEVNFRNSTWSYAFTYGGVNLPVLWAKSTLNGSICKADITLKESYTAMNEIADFKESVLTGKVSLLTWIRDVFSTSCLYYFNKKDVKPFYSKIYNSIFKRTIPR